MNESVLVSVDTVEILGDLVVFVDGWMVGCLFCCSGAFAWCLLACCLFVSCVDDETR